MQLLNKRIDEMQSDKELKQLWMNPKAVQRLKNQKLKCLLNACDEGNEQCGIDGTHCCGQFFSHYGIDQEDIKR